MKIKLLASLVAATILTGCSSSSGSKSEDIDPGFDFTPKVDNPIELDPEFGNPELDPGFGTTVPTYGDITETHNGFAITGDNGVVVTVDTKTHESTVIYTESGVFTINENNEITNYSTGEVVGHVQITDDKVTLRTDNGTEIVLRNENGRLFAAVIARPDTSHPIRDIIVDHEYADYITVDRLGRIIVGNDQVVGDSGYRVQDNIMVGKVIVNPDGETVGVIQSKEFNYGLTYSIIRHENGITIVQSRNELGKHSVEAAKTIKTDELKDQAQSLTPEQKSQLRAKSRDLREAIKAKVERS